MKKPRKKSSRRAPPRPRIPLPRKTEKRHGDASKFDRRRDKERVRRELDVD